MPKGKKIEPLDLDELENNPSLNGMLGHFEVLPIDTIGSGPKAVGAKPIGANSGGSKEVSTSDEESGPAAQTATRVINTSKSAFTPTGLTPIGIKPSDLNPSGEPLGAMDPDEIDLSEVLAELATVPQPSRSRGKIVPATRVEHGHSATQDALYWFLWRAGKSVKGSRSHYVQAGYAQIQASIGVDRSNVQDAIRELQKKLAIRVVKANTVGSATIYEVFSCDEILAKRKEARLVWARTYGKRRVELMTETEAVSQSEHLGPTGLAPTGISTVVSQPADLAVSAGERPIVSVGVTPTGGIGVTPIQQVKKAKSKTDTTTDVQTLREFLVQQIGYVDEEAAEKLLSECRSKAGDNRVTTDDIIAVVRAKLPAARKARNPVGLLIDAVPKHFPLSNHRLGMKDAEEISSGREYWERVLASPDAPQTLKEEAKRLLA